MLKERRKGRERKGGREEGETERRREKREEGGKKPYLWARGRHAFWAVPWLRMGTQHFKSQTSKILEQSVRLRQGLTQNDGEQRSNVTHLRLQSFQQGLAAVCCKRAARMGMGRDVLFDGQCTGKPRRWRRGGRGRMKGETDKPTPWTALLTGGWRSVSLRMTFATTYPKSHLSWAPWPDPRARDLAEEKAHWFSGIKTVFLHVLLSMQYLVGRHMHKTRENSDNQKSRSESN